MKGRLRLIIIVVVALLVLVIAAFLGFNVLGPMLFGGAQPEAEAAPEEGHEKAAEAPAEGGHEKAATPAAKATTKAATKAKAGAKEAEAAAEHGEVGPIIVVPERIVNLSGEGPYSILQITMALEFAPTEAMTKAAGEAKKKVKEEFLHEQTEILALIEDGVNTILSSKNGSDLNTPEGKEKLKREILEAVNKFTAEPVVGVYFTKFFMQ